MREGRPVAGRMPRLIIGRRMGLQPKYTPSSHGAINRDSGTPGVGGDGYSTEAQQFFDRASDPGATRKGQYATMIDALVSAGVWAKLDAFYVFAAADSTTALVNLKASSFGATLVNAPAFQADRGFTGANTKYIETGFNPTTASSPKFVLNSASVFAWSRTTAGISSGIMNITGTDQTRIYPRFNDDNMYVNVNGGGGGAAPDDGSGFFVATRTAADAVDAYRNAVSLIVSSGASSGLTNGTLRVLTSEGSFWTGQCAAAGIGSGLSGANVAAFYNALLAYMQAVGASA